MFYIGSTSIEKIQLGYHGSVGSMNYRSIWESEIDQHPELFKTTIISKHSTRKSALAKECILQKKLNVVKNTLYTNQATASENGFFGKDTSKKNNGFFGKKHTPETLVKMRKPKSEKTKERMRKPKSKSHIENFMGNTNWKYRDYTIKEKCVHCGMEAMKTNITRWHNSNCKLAKELL
jgi:hypothetical protein